MYLVRFKAVPIDSTGHIVKGGKQGAVSKVDMFIMKQGELKTSVDRMNGREIFLSGAVVTAEIEKATRFTITEASRYQRIIGVNGKRGQIVKDVNENA
jgi:hypothetical protein